MAINLYTNSKCPTLKALAKLELYLWEQKWHGASEHGEEAKAYREWQRVYRKMQKLRLRSMYHGPLYGHPEEAEDEGMPNPEALA